MSIVYLTQFKLELISDVDSYKVFRVTYSSTICSTFEMRRQEVKRFYCCFNFSCCSFLFLLKFLENVLSRHIYIYCSIRNQIKYMAYPIWSSIIWNYVIVELLCLFGSKIHLGQCISTGV